MTAINPFITSPARKSHTVSNAAAAAAKTEVPDRPNYVSIYGSTIFAMTVIFLIGVGVPAAMAYGNAVGWGIGAFCALWGAPASASWLRAPGCQPGTRSMTRSSNDCDHTARTT